MNGYCQINMNGQVKGLKFNLHAVYTLQKLFPKKTEDPTNTLFVAQLIYAGLCGNRYIKSVGADPVCEETFEEVSDWVDENIVNKKVDAFAEIFKAFASSKAISQPEDVEKKSLVS